MTRICAFLVVVLTAALPSAVSAKGTPTRIVITSPALPAPIEITDASLLRTFTVWSGEGVTVNGVHQTDGFIVDWRSDRGDSRPRGLERFEVAFYETPAAPSETVRGERLIYVVTYELDARNGVGYVYLPGKGEDHYALNTQTIFRGREGRWLRATDAWTRTVTALLARR
jgi:hypothetical protein